MIRLSAWLAIALGAVLGVAQIARNFNNLANWPTWTIDLVAAGLLLVAGFLALTTRLTRLLPVGWSFACGLFASGLVAHWNATRVVTGDLYDAEQRLVMILTGMLAVSLVGILLLLLAPPARPVVANEKRPAVGPGVFEEVSR